MQNVMRLFFVLFSFSSFGQDLNSISFLEKDGIKIYTEEYFYEPFFLGTGEDYKKYNFIVKENENKFFFIDKLGGNIFKYLDNQFLKIDNSFQHKMQIGSSIFILRDTIFRHGGYGFWETREILTFFDFNSKEWDRIKSVNNGFALQEHLVFSRNNKVIFIGGKKEEGIKSKGVYEFDFELRRWSKKGVSKFYFDQKDRTIDLSPETKMIIRGDSVYLISPFENKIKVYKGNSFLNNVISESNLKSFYKDSLFYFVSMIHAEKRLEKNIRKHDEVLSNIIIQEDLIEEKNQFNYLILLLIIFSTLLMLYKVTNKSKRELKSRIFIKEDNLYFKKRRIKIFDEERKVIESIFNKNKRQGKDILDDLDKKELNYNHQIRILNKIISDLNIKITPFLNLKDSFILVSKSNIDKRIKMYLPNQKIILTSVISNRSF